MDHRRTRRPPGNIVPSGTGWRSWPAVSTCCTEQPLLLYATASRDADPASKPSGQIYEDMADSLALTKDENEAVRL